MRPPDYQGVYGQAWQFRGELKDEAWRVDRWCGTWLVRCPGAHPFWSFHTIQAISLAEHPEQPNPPFLRFPGATHELMVLALNPEHDAGIDPDVMESMKWMVPPDFAGQAILPSDAHAKELVEFAARACCDGVIVPDSDFRAHWQGMLDRTAEHMRIGGHPDG